MDEKILKYDAFISYRHSELDKFVATTLHKKLEAFKLPKGVKSPTGKKKIERVFRDQDELPLASNLSDPITLALENSDFLLVICTPRLPESEWCQKEIETFIKLHGRERVLAVLAEGEPEESFPEALTKEAYEVTNPDGTTETKYRIFEPLAADVRGKNNKAIKKAMNDAVLRLCAAMFGLNYDEVKQRHKERAMKRTISIVSAVAAALMLFSAVCIGLMFKIINQSEMILDQNAEITQQYHEIQNQAKQISEQKDQIEEQFTEAQINLAKATTINAEELISEGRKYDAVYALRQVMPASSKDNSYPYTADAEYAMANALEVYADHDLLYAGRTFDSESIIEEVKISDDYSKLATIDACQNFHVWDTANGQELLSKTLNLESYYKKEYCFDFIDENTLLYCDNGKIIRLNLADNTESEISNPDGSDTYFGSIYRFFGADKFAVFSSDGFALFDTKSGNLIAEHSFPEVSDDISFPTIFDVILSEDGNTLYFSLSEAFTTNTYVAILDIASDSLLSTELPIESGSSLTAYGDNVFISGYVSSENALIYDHYIFCIDRTSGKIKWKNTAPGFFYEMKPSSEYKYIFASGYDCLYVLDPENGDTILTLNAYSKVCNLIASDRNRAVVLTSDCMQYGYLDGYSDLYLTSLFNNRPEIQAERFIVGYGKVFIKFNGTTYVSLYEYKDFEADPVLECNYSLTMCINDAEQFVRKNSDTGLLELYSMDSKEPLATMENKYSYNTFVGDGSEYLANYGLGLIIYNTADGSVYKEVPSLDCPTFDENAVTNDRNYIYSGRDFEDHIFLYSLTTGAVEDIFKPDIPSGENIKVYGLDKEHYAVKRESGALEIYKGKETKPYYTVDRLLSGRDDFKVINDSDLFAIAYLDQTVEFYRFGDTVEQVKTFSFTKMSTASFDALRYYPEKNIYIACIGLKTLVLNENLEPFAYLPMKADYLPSRDSFIYHYNSNALYTVKRYSYDDLMKEANMLLNDYVPSKSTLEKYNIAD